MFLINKEINFYSSAFNESRGNNTVNKDLLQFSKILQGELVYYVEIGDYSGVQRILPNIKPPIIEAMKDGSIKLVICNTHEAHHKILAPIYTELQKYEIPPKSVYIISESRDISKANKETAEKFNTEPANSIWSRVFEWNIHHQLQEQINSGKQFKTLYKKEYFKKFLNFNRRLRLHRPVFTGLLKAYDLLDKGYVSFSMWEHNFDYWQEVIETHTIDQFPFVGSLLREHQSNIKAIPTLYLDTEELHINQPNLKRETDHYYENTFFSLVSETNYYQSLDSQEPGVFFSEKIFKPIAELHPFVLIASPYSLKVLKEIGYKTFHPYIDESYDNEPNDDLRFKMLISEVKRLCELSTEQIHEFIDNVTEICKHNQQWLLQRKIDEFNQLLP